MLRRRTPTGSDTHTLANNEKYQADLKLLSTSLNGDILLPHTEEYELRRIVWNGAKSPALIVRPTNTTDVVAAVNFAREHDMAVAVKSGGHSTAGHSSSNGGVMIDLARMHTIDIDPKRNFARIEPGLTWGEVAMKFHYHGLAISAGDTPSVGVGGLTLGGGIGWMVRKYGLAIDHLKAVEIVTAAGQILRASAEENADLFWGLRGGGGNFGVATAFEFEPHKGGNVIGGAVYYDAEHEGEKILRAWRNYMLEAPDELMTHVFMMPPSDRLPALISIMVCYTGDLVTGNRVVAPLRKLGKPLADQIKAMPYASLVPAVDTEDGFMAARHHTRSMFMKRFSNEAIRTILAQFTKAGAPPLQIRILGGAMKRVPVDATAFAHRDKEAFLVAFGGAELGSVNAEVLRLSMEQAWSPLEQYQAGAYVNFLDRAGMGTGVHDAYPDETYARLVTLKNKYDPTNMFRHNHNIKPTR
jgi:FAD/FMN-containing dehydrogenase